MVAMQGNRVKEEEVRAKSAKHAKDLERGLIQSVDQPLNISFEQIKGRLNNNVRKKIFLHFIILAVLVALARATLLRFFNAFALGGFVWMVI